jgi:hypothetical protein
MASTSKTAESLYLFEREEGCTSVEDVELEPLSWRSDPEKNHSDWTIKIVCGDGSQSSTAVPTSYHVHKAVMGVGPRRCKYFSTLFQTQANVPEKKHSTSIISLAEPYANAFPMLLDFCYEFPGSQNLLIDSATNAMALRNIANYFGCDALRKYVNLFIENDIASSHSEKGPLYWTLELRCMMMSFWQNPPREFAPNTWKSWRMKISYSYQWICFDSWCFHRTWNVTVRRWVGLLRTFFSATLTKLRLNWSLS